MYKLSIIIPIYNTSKFLDQCLNSINNQKYNNYEIILVNDGSTDNSEQICLEFCEKNDRFKYYKKTNGGSSSARNFGLSKATGDFISFIDSDDYIENDSFEILVNSIVKYNADIIIFGRYKDYGNKKIKVFASKKDKVYKPNKVICEMLSGKNMDFSSWDKIYKKELWEDIEFPLGITGEDIVTIPKVIEKANKIIKIKECLYNYRYTPNSLTTSSYNSHTFDTLEILKEFENIFMKGNFAEKLSLNSFKVTQYMFYIQKLVFLNEDERINLNMKKYVNYLRKKIIIIFLNPYIKFKTKINVMLALSPEKYKSYLEKKK